jgi:hypothetical protein
MSWPMSQDYNEAIQDPAASFSDGELRAGQAATNALGLPIPRAGNFADVYEFNCPNTRRKWAVKCFTREVPGLRERYAEISSHLNEVKLPFTVDFQYLDQGIRIRGRWFPVLKMSWVEGLLLNEFVRDSLDKPALLQALSQIWLRMARRLREARVAHADLQHGNVILVPGSKTTSLAVKLIDYDGMWVPTLAGKNSGEVGQPSFQHPQRQREGTYSFEVDRFPELVVATALRALTAGGRRLWERHDNGDNLLFTAADFADPGKSGLLRELWELQDSETQTLTGHLALACLGRLEQAPLLDELAPDGRMPPLSTAKLRQAEAILGPCKLALPPPAPKPAATAVQAGDPAQQVAAAPLFADLSPAKAAAGGRRKSYRKQGGKWLWWLAAGGGVAACVALVLAVLARSPRPQSAPHQHALAPSTKSAGGTRPAPTTRPASATPVTAANGLHADLFRGTNFQQQVSERIDPQVDFLWGFDAPDPSLPPDLFSFRWEGWLKAPRPGTYNLIVFNDDGVRLWLDDKLIIDEWHPQRLLVPHQASVTLTARPHPLRIEYFDSGGSAAMSLRWEQTGGFAEQVVPTEALFHDKAAAAAATVKLPPGGDRKVNGLRAELFVGEPPLTNKQKTRIDPQVNFLWGDGTPDLALPADHFSIRWTGWLKAPRPGRYRLITASDDGVRVWLDDKLVIDLWRGQVLTRAEAEVELTDRAHALRIEYFEVNSSASMSFRWRQIGGFPEEAVPPTALFHVQPDAP